MANEIPPAPSGESPRGRASLSLLGEATFREATPGETILGETTSVCSECLLPLPARIVLREDKVWLEKTCVLHGPQTVLESSSMDFYHVVSPKDSCCGEGRSSSCCSPRAGDESGAGQGESGEPLGPSCVLLLEITDTCNLDCPLCFASSGPSGRFFMSRAEAEDRVSKVIAKKGVIDILMLSGGEPTAHPQFADLLEFAVRHPKIQRVLLNTNSVLLASPGRVRTALEKFHEKLEVYMQFDSLAASQAIRLRGESSVLEKKRLALNWLAEQNIPVTLAAAVDRTTTLEEVRDLLEFSISSTQIRGITFQPVFASGRHKIPYDPQNRITTPDVVRLITEALPEQFQRKGFTNLPCSHPNCAIVAYYYRANDRLWAVCEEIVPEESLKNRINFTLEDLKKCGCDTTELGQYVKSAELSPENSFRIVVKPFMDRFTLNRSRSEQCCTHVAGPNGKLMSFCEYNVFRAGLDWNRNVSDPT